MADGKTQKRDLSTGVDLADFEPSGLVAGVLGEDEILLARTPRGFRALSAHCTHKGAPLAKGLLVGEELRCPWHHACFDTNTGSAIAAPALKPLACWAVSERDGRVFVERRREDPKPAQARTGEGRIVIVGAGAAGASAADALARLGFGPVTTLLGHDADAPYDRTMLSKTYLAGKAPESKLPLDMDDLGGRGVDVRLGAIVEAIEPKERVVRLSDGTSLAYSRLILATGAEPRRLEVPGADLPHVRLLRSAADARGIIAALAGRPRVVVVGGSFIGLEVAAALRSREIEVTVVTPEARPFQRTLGLALSEAIMAVHVKHGTAFRLESQVARIDPDAVVLDDGSQLPADLVIVGIGVSPRTDLASAAGLAVDNGVVVDERLRTSDQHIYAAGDIARWPDPHSGEQIRVEHWAVAQRQGQIAGANAAGLNLRYDAVPFFWTAQFDLSVRYVGHASGKDDVQIDGDPAKEATIRFSRDGRERAVATVKRDLPLLEAEVAMEQRLGHPAVTLPD